LQSTLSIAVAIIAEASLSFLGLGQQPPASSWGSMLNTAKNFLEQPPWMAVWPGVAIFLVVIGFNLLGDGCATRSIPEKRRALKQFAKHPGGARSPAKPVSVGRIPW
jgi:ABC-type dipeptide/oligopeptide/nickel transport system permease subunit